MPSTRAFPWQVSISEAEPLPEPLEDNALTFVFIAFTVLLKLLTFVFSAESVIAGHVTSEW